jgi:hypothetical protein
MKINTFTMLLSFVLSGLFAFLLSYYTKEDNKLIIVVGSLISLTLTSTGIISISAEDTRKNWPVKIVSVLFTIAVLSIQLIFIALPVFIIQSYTFFVGCTIVIYVLTLYALLKTKLK